MIENTSMLFGVIVAFGCLGLSLTVNYLWETFNDWRCKRSEA